MSPSRSSRDEVEYHIVFPPKMVILWIVQNLSLVKTKSPGFLAFLIEKYEDNGSDIHNISEWEKIEGHYSVIFSNLRRNFEYREWLHTYKTHKQNDAGYEFKCKHIHVHKTISERKTVGFSFRRGVHAQKRKILRCIFKWDVFEDLNPQISNKIEVEKLLFQLVCSKSHPLASKRALKREMTLVKKVTDKIQADEVGL